MEDSSPSPSEPSPPHSRIPDNLSSNLAPLSATNDTSPGQPSSTDPPSSHGSALPGNTPDAPSTTVPLKAHVDAQGRTLNPRSCVTCRKRKVRCDKLHPCTNCARAHIECIFPAPGRAPRRTKKPGDGRDRELLERLRRLEGVVKGLGVEVPGEPQKDSTKDDDAQSDVENLPDGTREDHVNGHQKKIGFCVTTNGSEEPQSHERSQRVEGQSMGGFENRFGRLVINEGKSRYVNNSFWASLSNEVEDLKGILNQSSDEEEDPTNPPGAQSQSPSNHNGFIFGFSSLNVDLLGLHPPPSQISNYWEIYKDRVDPLVKVLHTPSLEPTILSAASHLSNLSRGFETLLFSIYYATVTSLSAADCMLKFGEEKSVLLTRYRFGLEQGLARANFLTTEELVVLQAFVIFLICLRRNSDARVIWTLTGLIVRIAQTIGVHRDGAHFGLSPFETEMRRRAWWQICILDIRASEDHGCDPTIIEQSFDTKMPLNINDEDISPDMKVYPTERQGCTSMSFSLLRFEVSSTFRRLNYVPPGPSVPCSDYHNSVTLEEKEKWITDCHQRIEERFLKHCDMSVPLFWVTATVARLMMSKMWLMVYHPFQRMDGGATLSQETRDKLFITSLENLEYSLLLETEARTMKWGWLFKTYMQWHALAFTLSELCHRTTGDMVERAWAAVEKTRDGRWGVNITDESNTGHLWRPLKKIYRKAKDARQRGLQEEHYIKQRAANPPTRTYSPNANPMFGHPQRPRVTRAPLSQAQLMRFTEGPAYGQAPIDKHELLRSPKLSDMSSPDPLDATGVPPNLLQQPNGQLDYVPQPGEQARLSPSQIREFLAVGPGFGENFLAGNNNVIDFNNFQVESNHIHKPLTPPIPGMNRDTPRTDSVDSLDNELSIMDTSGDVNWENWDQLVRQFGMDVDSGSYNTGNMTGTNGANWDMNANGANMRMGFGMNGGNLFQ